MRGDASTENLKGDESLPELEPSSKSARAYSLRMTKSKLWDPPEEDLPLLDSPLEVDSETPVADALIKRLQDEEKEGRKALAGKGVADVCPESRFLSRLLSNNFGVLECVRE